jgi:hypothetical protein
MAARRSFDELPIINCIDSTRLGWDKVRTPQGLAFVATVVAALVGAAAGLLPLFEWATRCLWNKNRMACIGSVFSNCKLIVASRLLGAVCCVGVVYVTFGHLLVFHLLFKYRTGAHVRVQGSAAFERERAAELKKVKAASRKRPCQTSVTSAESMLECADQWQPIALGVFGMITAAMLFMRIPVRFL